MFERVKKGLRKTNTKCIFYDRLPKSKSTGPRPGTGCKAAPAESQCRAPVGLNYPAVPSLGTTCPWIRRKGCELTEEDEITGQPSDPGHRSLPAAA